MQLIVTCEHARNRVPADFAERFARAGDLLDTHRGYDIGAAAVARRFARKYGGALHLGRVTRLVVDLNRSLHHRHLFSWMVADLPRDARARTIARYYAPYRDAVEADIARMLRGGGRVFHVSVHSFTPELDGHVRNAELGLLYDPGRRHETRAALRWQALVRAADPAIRVRRNYPYAGVQDGFQPHLRRRFSTARYTALELEMNQAVLTDGRARRGFVSVLDAAFGQLLAELRK